MINLPNVKIVDAQEGVLFSESSVEAKNIVTRLSSFEVRAGETVRILVELRDSEGLLVNPGNADDSVHMVRL